MPSAWAILKLSEFLSKRLLKSSLVVSVMTFLSRILGLVRDVIFSQYFGTMDAFLVAFKIPNFFRRMFAEGAFAQSFVPVLTDFKENKPNETADMIANVVGTLGGILFGLTIVGVVAAPVVVFVFANGFYWDDPQPGEVDKFALTTDLLRITWPYLLLISLTACFGGVLNAFGKFAIPAVAPVFLNICFIVAAVFFAAEVDPPELALAVAVFVAGVIQLAIQIPPVYRLGLLRWPRWGWAKPAVQRIIKLMLPIMFGASIAQLSLLLDTLLASFLQDDSVSWLYYSDRLMEFPLGVFIVALATVVLPGLSRQHSTQNPEGFSKMLDWALRMVVIIGVPSAVGLLVLSGPLLATIFYNAENFGVHAVQMSQYSLIAYAFGLLGFSLVKPLVSAFFARQETKTPVKIGMLAMLINIVLNLVFVGLAMANDFAAAHAGLALATSIGAFANALFLYSQLRRDGVYTPEPGWWLYIARLGIASVAMGVVVWWFSGDLDSWIAMARMERIMQLAMYIIVGMVTFAVTLVMTGFNPMQLWRGKP